MQKPQWKKILEYMQGHDGITPMESIYQIGCTRLAARIADLKRKGYMIATSMEYGLNRDGVKVKYAKYRLTNINN